MARRPRAGKIIKWLDRPAPEDALLYVPKDTARSFDIDIRDAGIQKVTDEGKLDFHSCRVTYINMVLDAGTSVKDAMALARHSTPNLTLNVYGRARKDRLAEIGQTVGKGPKIREIMAEREGFEPSVRLLDVHTLSKRAQSTTLTPLRGCKGRPLCPPTVARTGRIIGAPGNEINCVVDKSNGPC